ncbi:MAG: class I SAM-dependent methyltransferase [Anaerolineae bacterium]|nr:class I SAM-dependent methyltransferase [Anaerolineae bacterium]MDW8171949.1 methyltransferase domain-containing protein [Anaerolineae bacterium]
MIANPEQCLNALWGLIDRQHNAQIASCLAPGCRVLDFGSGYGSLVAYLLEHGFDAFGLDIDAEAIVWANKLYPHVVTYQQTVENFAAEQPRQSLDAIVLRDSFHHLYNERDPHSAFELFSTCSNQVEESSSSIPIPCGYFVLHGASLVMLTLRLLCRLRWPLSHSTVLRFSV